MLKRVSCGYYAPVADNILIAECQPVDCLQIFGKNIKHLPDNDISDKAQYSW